MAKNKHQELFQAAKNQSTLLVLFIPSVDRRHKPIHQQRWVDAALEILGKLFGGATAFPKARGVWRDDQQRGKLIFDEPVIIQCYTSALLIDKHAAQLRNFLVKLGTETNQGAVGLVIDRDYLELSFPEQE